MLWRRWSLVFVSKDAVVEEEGGGLGVEERDGGGLRGRGGAVGRGVRGGPNRAHHGPLNKLN